MQSAESLGDQISEEIGKIQESTIIFLLLGSETENFLRNYTLQHTFHFIVVEDFERSMVSNYTLFEDLFGSSFYFEDNQNAANTLLKKKIEAYKGLVEKVVNKYSVLIYMSLQMMKLGYASADSFDSDNIRYALYNMEFDSPLGKMKVFENNYVSQYNHLVKIRADGVLLNEFYFPRPIYPMPYHPLDNNGEYYDVSFALNENGTIYKKNYIAIVFFMDIITKKPAFINYDLSRIPIEEINYSGGIKGYEIVSELYQCPANDVEAAATILNLKNRGISIIIGGCDTIHKDYMRNIVESLNMVFFYTGFNAGSDCSKNMYIYTVIIYYLLYIVFIFMILLLRLLFHQLYISYTLKVEVHI